MAAFAPRFTINNRITAGLTTIERARGFLEAATLSDEWVRRMSQRALLVEAYATTHIEGAQLTLAEAEQAWAGDPLDQACADDVRDLLNYRSAFTFVSEYLGGREPIREGLREHGLNERQAQAIGRLLEQPELAVEELEKLYPGVHRRTLQRDLQALVEKRVVKPVGAGRGARYRLGIKGL